MTIPMPESYIAAHSAGYTGFRDMIVLAAKEWLQDHPGKHSTKEVSDALWPTRAASGYNIEIRKRLVDVLLKCADDPKHLGAYAVRGAISGQVYGKAKRPWIWEAPTADHHPKGWATTQIGGAIGTPLAVAILATPEAVANVLSTMPGGEYLSGAQKLGMARGLLERFKVFS